MRKERDSLGEVLVDEDRLYGAQTKRSLENFPVGDQKVPLSVIHALVLIKKAAAIVNAELGLLSKEKSAMIVAACDDVLSHKYDDHFPLKVWQTGSGTQTNMNVNEVLSNIAISKVHGVLGSKDPIHPNDDVNKSQSSNDTFPTAMHLAALIRVNTKLLPSLRILRNALAKKSQQFWEIVKIGRTHAMDATPLTLGQEFSGYVSQLDHVMEVIENVRPHLAELAVGGTAVGTGINTHAEFAVKMAQELSQLTGESLKTAPNKFEALANSSAIVEMSGALRLAAVSLFKIANDIRLLSSGPRSGIGEITIPSNEPGSSIMPGKVNPTQCESITQVAAHVIGCDAAIGFAGSQGLFELNVYRPMMIYNLMQAIDLLSDSCESFSKRCVEGIEANTKRIAEHLNNSLMLVTALNTTIGYDKSAQIAKKAYHDNTTLKQAALDLGFISAEEFDRIVDPSTMVHIERSFPPQLI